MSIASDVGGAIGLLLGLCGINLIEMALLAWDMAWGYGDSQVKQSDMDNLHQNQKNEVWSRSRHEELLSGPAGVVPNEHTKQQALQLAAAALDRELLRQQLAKTRREINVMSNNF